MKRSMLGIVAVLFSLCSMMLAAQPPGGSGDGVWTRNAYFGEHDTFDSCFGHQPGNGQYHHHVQPVCLRAQLNDNLTLSYSGRTGNTYRERTSGWTHSPILGWALDGYPIYGPYGYSNAADAGSAVKRMKSSFQLRAITQRHSLPTWALSFHAGVSQNLASNRYGPDVSVHFPLGRYIEDYDYVAGSGDLDQYNGRTTVTPEFPKGTYAYFVTIDDNGAPAFPFITGLQYNGQAASGQNVQVAAGAQDYFVNNAYTQTQTSAQLTSWYTKGSNQKVQVISGYDPSAGPQTTWPTAQPAGVQTSGGQTTPVNADVQRIRFDGNSVYVNSNGLPSYTIGPWFAAASTTGVFFNWPSSQNALLAFPRSPAAPATKSTTGLGAIGMWVNGVAIFNAEDGASYSTASGDDVGGGIVKLETLNISAGSEEGGPVTAGTIMTAYGLFGASLATSTASTPSANWPTTLGGTNVTVRDSTGTTRSAQISYASPSQVNFRIPKGTANGTASVTFSTSNGSVSGGLYVVSNYPGLFTFTTDKLAASQVVRVSNGVQIAESTFAQATDGSISSAPISLGSTSDQTFLVLYGTGLGANSPTVTATIGGMNAPIVYAGAQGTFPGLDQINLLIPNSLSGKGKVSVVVTANGKASNPVYVVLQ